MTPATSGYAAITSPKPSILSLTPSMRAQCQRPCGVDEINRLMASPCS